MEQRRFFEARGEESGEWLVLDGKRHLRVDPRAIGERGSVGSGPMSKAPDRSHIADAIHLMDLVHLVDEEVPAANAIVERSKASAVTARIELEKHQRWLEGHQELYAEAVKGCQRQLKRQAFVRACKQTALLPIQLLASACVALGHAAWAYVRRFRLRAKLQNRIQAMDQRSGPRLLQNRIEAMDSPRLPTGPGAVS